jgi:hypothetical protein
MNALEIYLAEHPSSWYDKDFVWHDDAGNIFIIPDEDDWFWDSIDYIDDDDWFYNWEDQVGVYMISPMIRSNKIVADLLKWSNRPNKRTGWRTVHDEEPNVAGCPYCPANRGCNSSPYRFKRKNWKRLRKTQYK